MRTTKSVFLVLFLIAAMVFSGGCGGSDSASNNGGDSDTERGVIIDAPSGDRDAFINENLAGVDLNDGAAIANRMGELFEQSLRLCYAGADTGAGLPPVLEAIIKDVVAWFLTLTVESGGLYLPVPQSFEYTTIDANGKIAPTSGLAIVPILIIAPETKPELPMLALHHGTQVERKFSPSKLMLTPHKDPQLTVPYGLLLAALGYIVVIPDYLGLGDNADPHPYCHTSLAYSVEDMMKVVNDYLNSEKHKNYKAAPVWNKKQVYLTGFSEGGYATMVTAKQLQKSRSFPVTAVAPVDGPYSLSTTMRNVMQTADKNFSSPYFLPMMIVGYEAAYPVTPEFSFKRAIRSDYYLQSLHAMFLKGESTSEELSKKMTDMPGYTGPLSITTPEFQTLLADANSNVVKTLEANNSFHGWSPAMKMKPFHLDTDDLVPAGNLKEAIKAFSHLENFDSGGEFGYSAELYAATEGVPKHVLAALGGHLLSFRWLDRDAYPTRYKPLNPERWTWLKYTE